MKKLLLIALILTFAAGTAIAQQGGNGNGGGGNGNGKPGNGQQGGGGYGDPIDRMTELLGLDEAQIAALELIFEDSQAAREQAREAMRQAAEAHRADVHAQILGVLEDDQVILWEEHRQQREALRQTLEEMGYGRGSGGNGNRGGGGRGTGDCNG